MSKHDVDIALDDQALTAGFTEPWETVKQYVDILDHRFQFTEYVAFGNRVMVEVTVYKMLDYGQHEVEQVFVATPDGAAKLMSELANERRFFDGTV